MPYKEGRKWRAKVTCEGKRYTKLYLKKKQAIQWEIDKREELKKEASMPIGMDLLTFCNRYSDFAGRHFSKNTYQEKKSMCERVLKEWGNLRVSMITPQIILDYLDAQVGLRSTNAYNKDRKNLMAMFNYGNRFLGLTGNPMVGIPTIRHDRSPQYVPPTTDILKVLAVATREERVFLDCYLNTGARRSEIFRLTWHQDINFERRQIRLGTRKTRDGSMEYEWVPMNDELHDSLWWWWNNRTVRDTPWVFVCTQPGPWYGQPYTHRRKFMSGLCARAKVTPFGFHALRRYVASYLADIKKISAKSIQRILRHKNVHTTERYIKNLNVDLSTTYGLLGDISREPEQKGTQARHERKEGCV